MADVMRSHQDDLHANKLQQLVEKGRFEEMSIAFCGHFSAGKSTMINTLLGVELLPANPIPTSANVVKIRGGEPAASVHTRKSGVLTLDPHTDLETLKKHAVDGDEVEWVEICYPGLFLTEKTSLLDTPGIDSTDAAHKVATESALHLADVIIYMMDYNHVQAEENFNFTKMLKDRGKPVYLVINMIDKHVDFELDFDSYKESVEDAFDMWNIKPDGIFYTTLAESDHPENQYEEFRSTLLDLYEHGESLISQSILLSAKALIDEHGKVVARQHQPVREKAEETIETQTEKLVERGLHINDQNEATKQHQQLLAKIAELQSASKNAYNQMEKELTDLLQNARITYYSTNTAAKEYLDTRKPGFKVGFLFGSAKKTEDERAARIQALRDDIKEKVSANLDFHFRQLLTSFIDRYGVRSDSLHQQIHDAKIDITEEWLTSQVKQGAGTDEYVMNYCKDISDGIKISYRRVALLIIEQIVACLEEMNQQEQTTISENMQELEALQGAYLQFVTLTEAEKSQKNELMRLLYQ
ncbi:dynamin family protein [Brevibacillus daliensis]|uniref:dynamin family protein n=1 Tax=Brevibacillus daliensis TaxID=2892995 RepID=UPI00359F2A46